MCVAALQQRACVGQAFDVGDHDPRLGVVDQGIDEFDRIEIGLVPGSDHVAETDALLRAGDGDAVTEATALRHQGHRSGPQLRRARDAAERCVDIVVDVGVAQAVRTDEAHPACASERDHLVLQRRAAGADLTETAAQHGGIRYFLRRALGDYGIDAARWNADDREVDLGLDRGNRRVAAQPLVCRVVGIDRKNPAPVSVLQQRAHRLRARPHGVLRHANDGDRPRREQAFELAAHNVSCLMTTIVTSHRRLG